MQPDRQAVVAQVGPLRAADARAAGRVLADSLHADPGWSALLPDPGRRARALRASCTAAVRDALPFGAVQSATVGGEVAGAAVWLPPGAYPMSLARGLRAAVALLPLVATMPGSVPAMMRFGRNVEREFPREPVWYLEILGVAPGLQGLGLGGRLLAPALALADRDGEDAYLETAKRENVGYYQRHGFAVERDAVPLAPGGPPHWTMRRRPARGNAPEPGAPGGP